jgi:hypothetical protein
MIKKLFFVSIMLMQFCIYAQDFKFGKVSKEELQEQFYPLDSTADAAYLFKYRKSYFDYEVDDGFRVITEIHNRIKIYNSDGLIKGTQKIFYYTPKSGKKDKVKDVKAYTFNLEKGKVVKENVSKKSIFVDRLNNFFSVKKIAMPNVKQYSVIDIKYKIISPFVSIDNLKFQYDIPIKKLNYLLEIPEYFQFREHAQGYYYIKPKISFQYQSFKFETPDKMVTKSGGYVTEKGEVFKLNASVKINVFNEVNIPALKDDEVFTGNIANYRGALVYELQSKKMPNSNTIYYTDTWDHVGKKIYQSGSFGEELEKSNYYLEDLNEIIKNASQEKDKIAAIFQFVKTKVKWNNYYSKFTSKGVRKAYNEGSGNVAEINLILTSMLRSAGLSANPVLVSSRLNGIPFFPTIKGFNYVISKVTLLGGQQILLDATEVYSLPNILPKRILNWKGREIFKDGTSSWVKLTSAKHALEDNMLMVKVTDDFMVEGFIRTKLDNLNALSFRNNYNHLNEEGLIAKYEENNNLEITDFKLENKRNIAKPIVRKVKFSSEDLIEGINGKLYIEPLLFLTRHENPFKLKERKFPIDFSNPWKNINRVNIEIPKGYKVEKLPESIAIGLPENMGFFKYQVVQVGNKIKTVSVLQFNEPLIGAQYYKDLKAFYSKLVNTQTEKIVLIKE